MGTREAGLVKWWDECWAEWGMAPLRSRRSQSRGGNCTGKWAGSWSPVGSWEGSLVLVIQGGGQMTTSALPSLCVPFLLVHLCYTLLLLPHSPCTPIHCISHIYIGWGKDMAASREPPGAEKIGLLLKMPCQGSEFSAHKIMSLGHLEEVCLY